MTGWSEQHEFPWHGPRQPDSRERLRCMMEQTVWDRRLLDEMDSMSEPEIAFTLGDIALATVDSYKNGDSHNIAGRLERLYASLSIETYKGAASLNIIDRLQVVAMDSLSAIDNEALAASAKEEVVRARSLGLNPMH